jgi:glutamate synthase (NADPH/NADH) large chain
MLEKPEESAQEFVKVTPRDYQAVLRTREQAETEGLDPNGEEVWSRILEVTGG